MTAPANADVLAALARNVMGCAVTDNQAATFATAAGAQAQGLRATGEIVRIVTSVATGAVVLPSMTTTDAPDWVWVINDSPNSINVGAASGDKMNTVSTTSSFGAGILAVAAAATGVFISSKSPTGAGGGSTASPNNWHGSVLT